MRDGEKVSLSEGRYKEGGKADGDRQQRDRVSSAVRNRHAHARGDSQVRHKLRKKEGEEKTG
jgi:hypothetical protein